MQCFEARASAREPILGFAVRKEQRICAILVHRECPKIAARDGQRDHRPALAQVLDPLSVVEVYCPGSARVREQEHAAQGGEAWDQPRRQKVSRDSVRQRRGASQYARLQGSARAQKARQGRRSGEARTDAAIQSHLPSLPQADD